MPRQAKTLLEHILDRTFRPTAHQRLLAGVDLPLNPPHRNPTPAMTRLWARLRAQQSEFRDVSSVEVRHDLAHQFGSTAREYMDAVDYGQLRPEDDVAGLAEILAVNDAARALWEAEQAGGS